MKRVAKVAVLIVALLSLFLVATAVPAIADPIHVGGSLSASSRGHGLAHQGGASLTSTPIHVGGS